jgi:hypothetical protein
MQQSPTVKLLAILAELHRFEGVANYDQPLRLGLDIEGRPFLRLCEQWGDGIRVDNQRLEPADFGEGGSVEVADVTAHIDPRLAGAELRAARLVENREGHTMGLVLQRPDAPDFYIWIQDDEFHWGEEPALKAACSPDRARVKVGREA